MVDFGSLAKIVIVEDEESLAEIYKTRLELLGYICFVAHEGLEALVTIERERPSLCFVRHNDTETCRRPAPEGNACYGMG